MDDGGGVLFSVVYFDGQVEATVGEVTVDSSLSFNKFLSLLSQKIGISPHKFSVYLATLGTNRRIPITGKVNFGAVARDSEAATSFFLVEPTKRPRSRRNKSRKKANSGNESNAAQENVVLLRRNDGVAGQVMGRVEYEKWVRDLQMERERYLVSMGIRMLCQECLTGADGGFHRCVYDAVTQGFRSPAGPIARPVKGSG
ncbi:hypothetical protein VNO78_17916 [Psophocarpus tetragonolobus]|uniref:DUF7138 domain-containing protein n=1 Tax=Psophocarpus tetragonolobus TaxID=3891 RepID=A0AAN9SNG4_PSOTE